MLTQIRKELIRMKKLQEQVGSDDEGADAEDGADGEGAKGEDDEDDEPQEEALTQFCQFKLQDLINKMTLFEVKREENVLDGGYDESDIGPLKTRGQLDDFRHMVDKMIQHEFRPRTLHSGDTPVDQAIMEFVNVTVLTLQALFAAPALAEQETDFSGMSFFGECEC